MAIIGNVEDERFRLEQLDRHMDYKKISLAMVSYLSNLVSKGLAENENVLSVDEIKKALDLADEVFICDDEEYQEKFKIFSDYVDKCGA